MKHVFRHPKIAVFFFAALFFMSIAQCTTDTNKASISIKLPGPASVLRKGKTASVTADRYNIYIKQDGKIVDQKENIVGSRYVVFGFLDEGTYTLEAQALAQDGSIISDTSIGELSLEPGKETSCSVTFSK